MMLDILGMLPMLAQAAQSASNAVVGNLGVGVGAAGIMIGAGVAVAGAGRGIGNIGGSAVEAIARQPEAKGSIGTNMIIAAALIEGFTFFALVIGILLMGKLG
jgi:F-type H+-transporting ATPase subunit c